MENSPKIVIFDLDDTLISTQMIKDIQFAYLTEIGFTDDEIKSTYKAVRDNYSTDIYIQALNAIHPEKNIDKNIFENSINETILFQDSIPTLESLQANPNIKLILLTKGNIVFQNKKIDVLKLRKYFKEVWPTAEEKEKFLANKFSNDQEFIFINDKLTENEKIQKHFPNAVCYLIDRLSLYPDAKGYINFDVLKRDAGL